MSLGVRGQCTTAAAAGRQKCDGRVSKGSTGLGTQGGQLTVLSVVASGEPKFYHVAIAVIIMVEVRQTCLESMSS